MKLSRKEFLHLSVSFVGVGLLGCGGSEAGNPDLATAGGATDLANGGAASCLSNGTKSAIGTNHGHTLTVTVADIQAAADKTYSIMGTSPHDHSVTLTAAHLADLAANKSVTTVSTSGSGHTHSVTISCA